MTRAGHGRIVLVEVKFSSFAPFPQRTVTTHYADGYVVVDHDYHYVSPTPTPDPPAAA